jgi:hypothetical protein
MPNKRGRKTGNLTVPDLRNLEHCPTCGGLLPEFILQFKGKQYWFTCYQIRKNDKLIVQTDYGKLAEHLKIKKKKE